MQVLPGSLIAGQHVKHNGVRYRIRRIRQLDGPPNEYQVLLGENLYVTLFDNQPMEVVA